MVDVKRFTGKWIPLLAGVLIGISVGGLVLFGLGLGGFSFNLGGFQEKNLDASGPQLNSAPPDFDLISLTGNTIHLREVRGKVVIINFWATWCAPCRLEMPILQNIYEQYKPRLTVFAVNAGEPTHVVKEYKEELDLTINILLDPEREAEKLYHLRGYPTTFFMDGDGTLIAQHVGALTEGQLMDYLRQVGIED